MVGAGLVGSLLALALSRRGAQVTLVDETTGPAATPLSYGVLLPGRDRAWRRLQRCHGDLGLRPLPVRLHGGGLQQSWLPRWLVRPLALPLARVDPVVLRQALVPALERAGVIRRCARVPAPPQRDGDHWRLTLVNAPGRSERLETAQLVLAAGACCRELWPALPDTLRVSWAGVLQLDRLPGDLRLPPGGALLPRRMQRLELEGRSPQLTEAAWLVDAGLVPLGSGWLAGQISLLRPGLELGQPPDPQLMERRLRQALASLAAALCSWPGRYRQAPVAFCSDGVPLSGPVPGEPGLWVCSGFSAAFSAVPAAVERLADHLAEADGISRARDRAPGRR